MTSRARGIATEVPVGTQNGLDRACVINVDSIITIPVTDLGRQIGLLLPEQEFALTEAMHAASDLD